MASVSSTRTANPLRVRAWWRSPDDQPGWARPVLLALTAVAGFLYAWNATGNLEIYYAAAVRSMSMSWHNFFFAAFDPAGTVSVDKLPGAFWVQALSVRAVRPARVGDRRAPGGRGDGERAGAVPGRAAAVRAARRDLAAAVLVLSPGNRGAQPRQRPRHADGPAAAAGGRRDGERDRVAGGARA